jgi:hypothetical protein
LKHYEFYPRAKNDVVPFYQRMSESFGATTVALRGNRAPIFRRQIERWLEKQGVKAYFLPNALAVPECVESRVDVLSELGLKEGSIVVPTSSGVIAASLIHAVGVLDYHVKVIAVVSSSFKNRAKKIGQYLRLARRPISPLFNPVRWRVVSLNRRYGEPDKGRTPFPSDVYLDRAPWWWLMRNIGRLEGPVYFWNIGGEWDPIHGLTGDLRGDGKVTKREVDRYVRGGEGEG